MSELTLSQYDNWFHARSSGNYNKSRWLLDQIKGESIDPPTFKELQKKLESQLKEWEKTYKKGTVCANMRLEQSKAKLDAKQKKIRADSAANLVRVAPAAIEIAAESAPFATRLGNTGGTYTSGEITPSISTYQIYEDSIKLRKKEPITKIDWLSVSFPYVSEEDRQRLLWAGIADLMERSGIEVRPRGKGHHGYTDSAELCIVKDAETSRNVGFLAWSERMGYFMELSGVGCDFAMKHVDDLYMLLGVYGGRITRLDIALDLHSDYCTTHGLTVPKFSKEVADGVYRSIFTPNHVKQRRERSGDWEGFLHGDITIDSYDPLIHAPAGLSVYAGSNKSDNQIVFYEKGKQLLGGIPEYEADKIRYMLSNPDLSEEGQECFSHLCDKHGVDPKLCHERGWIRVERRLRRGANKKYISPDMLLDPDSAFCHSMDGLTNLLQTYSQHVKETYTDIKTFRRVSAERLEVVSLTKKLHYARQSVGRLVHSLQKMDYSAEQIVEKLASDHPLKDVIFDLLE